MSDQDGGHRRTECVTINLDRLVNVITQSSARVGASGAASTSESLPRIEGNAVAHGLVSEFTFELNGNVWASNLFVTGWRGTSEYLLEALRRKISSSTTFPFFASGAALPTVWANYCAASQQQVTWDPFTDFLPARNIRICEVTEKADVLKISTVLSSCRPRPVTDALVSFPSIRIYLIHNIAALLQEAEATCDTELVFKGGSFKFLKRNNRCFTGFVELQQGKCDLKDGQRVKLTFQETGFRFPCRVKLARATASARPSGYIVTTTETDRDDVDSDSDADSAIGDECTVMLRTVRLPPRADDPKARHLVDIRLDYLDVDSRRQIKGFDAIQEHTALYSSARALLLANNMRSIPRLDFYDRIPGGRDEKNTFLTCFLECLPLAFNAKQKEAFFALRSIPYAHMVQGPGGTGKSEFATLACQPLLLTSPPSGPKNQILIVCGSNINVDDLAEQALEHSHRFLIALREPVVVRLHAYDTEIAVFTDNAAWKRALSLDKSKVVPGALAEMKKRGIFNIEEQLAEPYEDHRLQLRHQSLGHYMRRVIGVGALGTDDPLYVSDKFQLLADTLPAWADSKIPDARKKDVEKMLDELFDHILVSADIIVATTSNAAIPQIRSPSFTPCAIIVDEAGRLTEGAIWPILAFHGQVPTLFLGDRCQTGPFATAREEENGFCKQLRLPFFGRLLDAGIASTTFVRQHRFPSAVCDFLSKQFYADELESAPSVDKHPSIPRLKRFNKTHWGREELMVYVDMPYSKCQTFGENKTSKINVLQLALVLQKVGALLAAGCSGASIGIASPYSCMNQFVLAGRDWLALKHSIEAPKITVATIDGFTGLEVDIMFIPLVVGANIGFLNETSRICTALTGCRVGFVLIGNYGAMQSGRGMRYDWEDSALKKVILDLKQRGMDTTSNMINAPADMKDFLPDEKELRDLDTRDCYRCKRVGHISYFCPYSPGFSAC